MVQLEGTIRRQIRSLFSCIPVLKIALNCSCVNSSILWKDETRWERGRKRERKKERRYLLYLEPPIDLYTCWWTFRLQDQRDSIAAAKMAPGMTFSVSRKNSKVYSSQKLASLLENSSEWDILLTPSNADASRNVDKITSRDLNTKDMVTCRYDSRRV